MNTLCGRLLSEKLIQGRKGIEDIATDRNPCGTLVNIFDIVIIAGTYDLSEGHAEFAPNADMDNDGDVDIFDAVIAAGNYRQNRRHPPPPLFFSVAHTFLLVNKCLYYYEDFMLILSLPRYIEMLRATDATWANRAW